MQEELGLARRGPGSAGEPISDSVVARDLRFNSWALLIHGLFSQTGFRLILAPTFLPHFVSVLAGNSSAVGIVRAVQSLGQFLSPILSARMIERRSHAKSIGIFYGLLMRLMLLSLGLIALFAPREQALGLIWLTFAIMGFALGMQGVVFSFVLSKAIPVGKRGTLLGQRNASAGVVLLVVSWMGGVLVDRYGFPDGYGYTFLAGFALAALGFTGFAIVREPPTRDQRERTDFWVWMRAVPVLLRHEPDYRRFFVARLLVTAGRGALPLYIIFVEQQFGITGARLALLTILFGLAQSGSGLLWGVVGDRAGFKPIFTGGIAAWLAGVLLLMMAPSIEWVYVVFLLVGAGIGGFMLASQNLLMEFGTQRDRPMRIATSNAMAELVGMLGFLAAGLAADRVSLELVFTVSIGLHLLAVAQLLRVREPRVEVEPTIGLE